MEKNMKARVQHKHDIEANWLKAINFTPLISEIIVYDPDESYDYPRIKIGDGKTNINSLPFVTVALEALIDTLDTDKLDASKLPEAINDALAQAKESGEFDGEKGEPGNSGVYIGSTKPVDPDVHVWINPDEEVDRYVKSVNGVTPDENGNVEITIPEGSVGTNVTLDPTLTQSGAAADAKAVGDAIANIEIPSIEGLATEEYVDEAIANIDFPTGGSTKVMPLPLLADVTSAEALSVFEVTLSKRAIRRVLMQITIPASEAPGGAFYGRLNGKLWDAMIFGNAELPANGARWLELEFMEGSLAKFMVSDSSGGMWAISTANTCGALQPYNYVDSIGVALMSGKTTPAGTRIQVWGE